jgi:hypothetical protein
LVPGTGESKAILCYKARPLPQPPFSPQVDLKISLKFQLLQIETVTIKDDNVRGLWEAFSAAELSQTVGNVFHFCVRSGACPDFGCGALVPAEHCGVATRLLRRPITCTGLRSAALARTCEERVGKETNCDP